MNPFWSIERVENTDTPPERQHFIWLGDAERQAQRWLEASPAARVYLFRHRLALHGGDKVTVLVEIFSAERQPPLDRTDNWSRRSEATPPPPGKPTA